MRRSIVLAILLIFAVFVVLAYAAKPTPPPPDTPAIQGIARQDAEVNTPTVGTRYDLISLTGPGTFIGGRVLGIGGSGPSQFTLQLEIDGNLIVDEFVSGLAQAYTAMNPMGIMRYCATSAGMLGFCIGFIQPVAYGSNLTLSVTTAGAIDKVSGTVLYAE